MGLGLGLRVRVRVRERVRERVGVRVMVRARVRVRLGVRHLADRAAREGRLVEVGEEALEGGAEGSLDQLARPTWGDNHGTR